MATNQEHSGEAVTDSTAPSFRLPDLHGTPYEFADLVRAAASHDRDVLLVFTELECELCDVLLIDLVAAHHAEPDVVDLVIVTSGNAAANFLKFSSLGLEGLILRQQEREVSARFGIQSVPSAVVVSGDGAIVGGPAQGIDHVVALVGPYVGHVEDRSDRLIAGSPIPDVTVTGSNGIDVALRDVLTETTLLLFFEHHCAYCSAMMPELQQRLERWSANGPRVVLITTLEHEIRRDELPGVSIYREARLQASTAFGVEGTPSGALIGRDRTLLAPVVLGERPIWDLVHRFFGD